MSPSTLLQSVTGLFPSLRPTPSTTRRRPYLLRYRSSTTFITVVVCLAIFTDILLYGLIVPVIPYSLTQRAGVPEASLQQWNAILLACYSTALFVASPLAGVYADRTSSRRLPLLGGLLALAGSTLLLCLARNTAMLVVGRVLQGSSAGVVWSVGLALLADTMGRAMGVAMGWVSIALSVGLLVSPVVGGAVYERAGYYAVYYVAFSIIALDIALRLALVEKRVARRWLEPDTPETALRTDAAGGQSAVTDGPVAEGKDAPSADPEKGLGNTAIPTSAPAVVSSTPANPTSSARGTGAARHPNLELIKSRRLLAALYGCFTQAVLWTAFDTVLPLFVRSTFGWDSTAAGLIFLALFVPGFASPLVGRLADRYGSRWLSSGAFLAGVAPLACLRFVTENSVAHKALLAVLLALVGAILTVANTPLMAEISYAIEAKARRRPGVWGDKGVYGVGYGLFTLAFALGSTVGSIMSGYVVVGAGWPTLAWVLALFSAAGAAVVAVWTGDRKHKDGVGEGGGEVAGGAGGGGAGGAAAACAHVDVTAA